MGELCQSHDHGLEFTARCDAVIGSQPIDIGSRAFLKGSSNHYAISAGLFDRHGDFVGGGLDPGPPAPKSNGLPGSVAAKKPSQGI